MCRWVRRLRAACGAVGELWVVGVVVWGGWAGLGGAVGSSCGCVWAAVDGRRGRLVVGAPGAVVSRARAARAAARRRREVRWPRDSGRGGAGCGAGPSG